MRTILLYFLLGSAMADNLEKTQKKELENQVEGYDRRRATFGQSGTTGRGTRDVR
jgi:hypothetical protein